MDDHVHLLLCPLQKDDKKWYSLAEILKGMKGATAREINLLTNSSGSIWQKESFDRMIRNKDELFEKWHYIWNNPITAGLSDESIEYHYYIEPPQISASSFLEPTKVGSTKIL